MKIESTINSQLGYYLAGLIEGDGNIWTPKTFKSPNGRTYNPQITIAFHTKEMFYIEYLKQHFNTGCIYSEKNSNGSVYRVIETSKLIEIINLINGKFRTPKIKYLHRAIDQINLKHGTNIEKLSLDKSKLNSNAWLAGFTDADGNFHISLEGVYGLNGSLAKGRVKCMFTIAQRVIDKPTGLSCVPFMTEMADTFQCKINYYKPENKMAFVSTANNKHYLTRSYFVKYPLMSSKHLDYLCFLKGLDYLGKRLTDKEIMDIQAIKNSMNNKRTYYNWDHLINFYR